ncbi:MAG TPA: gliding motility-associated ABC transporter substrate-binding protein GldG [Bacteroidales bacterium]|nr:gliding motility-associated ABC transporter substrate-binding protein GldG [Bacteroidales bacterium]
MKATNQKKQHIIQLAFSVIILVLLGYISTRVFFRVDLTSEKRYTLSEETKHIASKLEDVAYVKVYLEGELPAGFKKFRNAIRETLDEMKIYAKDNIQYEFINPSENPDEQTRNKIYTELAQKGLKPTNIKMRDKEGGESEKMIFPGAIVSYQGMEFPIQLLKNNAGLSADENLNNSIQNIEYEITRALYTVSSKQVTKISFVEGHGELTEPEVNDIMLSLSNYQIDRGVINGTPGILDPYKAVIIAKPTKPFSEQDKLVIDQYIMHGGNVLWLVDGVNVNTDSLANGYSFGFVNNINLDDQLFTYGVRVNPDLVMDIQCNILPVQAGMNGDKPRWVPAPWLYYPLISPLVNHQITRDLNLVWARFASVVDTITGNNEVKKTFLLLSSAQTKVVNAPVMIRLDEVKHNPVREEFNKQNQPIAVLLEGPFRSVFRNRDVGKIIPQVAGNYKASGVPSKMIVVADGDMIANDIKVTPQGTMVTALGYDKYTRQTFGNKEFLVNAINYLADESGLLSLRSKDLKLRLLDKKRIRDEKVKWQVINTVLPVVVIIGFGLVFNRYRRKRYGKTA